MTLIAYKNGTLCADTLATVSSLRVGKPNIKIARRADGALFAAAGWATVSQHWMAWFLSGEKGPPPWRDDGDDFSSVLIIDRPSSMRYWASTPLCERITESRYSLGYPAYLNGIMDAGKSAVEALKIAIPKTTGSDYPLIEIGHSGPPTIWEAADRTRHPGSFFDFIGCRQEDYFAGN